MGAHRKRRLLLRIAASDRTFESKVLAGKTVLEGKCIHCGKKLVLAEDGAPLNGATLEHILPKNHGGTDDLDNLAIACARCNAEKGLRHDHKRLGDPKLQAVVERLQARRRERLRTEELRKDSLTRVRTLDEIAEVAELATEIWNEHFPPIIGQAQVDYMLGKFQSARAIERQSRHDGYEYYLVGPIHARSGYFALLPDPIERSMQLSKLYLRRKARGFGVGRRVIEWLEGECAARGFDKLWLTVNKDNAESIAFYEHVGLEIDAPTVSNIGGGFIMDDYRMVKRVPAGRG